MFKAFLGVTGARHYDCVWQGGDLAEPLMQQQIPSPSEESGYAGPDSRQQLDRYIPPGFTVESSGMLLAACILTYASRLA